MSIISKTDNIPAKRIVKALETIVLKGSKMWKNWSEAIAMERIRQKAIEIGANAVINFRYNEDGTHIFCTGLGVIVEDIETTSSPMNESSNVSFCESCGNEKQNSHKFCPFCGTE